MYVEIALYLINLHSVDLKAGTFHADFYLNFKGVRITETWGGGGYGQEPGSKLWKGFCGGRRREDEKWDSQGGSEKLGNFASLCNIVQ